MEVRGAALEAISSLVSMSEDDQIIKSLQKLCLTCIESSFYILQCDEIEGKEAI